jgi:hypothetical protein
MRNSQALSAILGTMYGPDDRTEAEAKSYFDQHEQTLTALVSLISQCEGFGRISMYPDGRVLNDHVLYVREPLWCPTAWIATLLKAANILWVNAGNVKPYGERGAFSAMFVLSSRGIVGHGSGSAIYHFPELERNPFGDSFPLAGTPGHWFYRHL